MTYLRFGNGPKNILFLHGLNSCNHTWEKLFPLLSKDFTCWAPQLPHYDQCNLDGCADLVLEFVKRHKLENSYLVGFSLGGLIGLKLLSLGVNFKRLVFISTLFISPIPRTQLMLIKLGLYLDKGRITEELMDDVVCKLMHSRIRNGSANSYLRFAQDMLIPKTIRFIHSVRIRVPFVVIEPRHDFFCWLFNSKIPYRRLRPQQEIVVKASHFIYRDIPGKVADTINTFFV